MNIFGARNNVTFSLANLNDNNIISMLRLSSFMGRMSGYGSPVVWEARLEQPDAVLDTNVIRLGGQVEADVNFSGDTAFLKLFPSLNGHYNLSVGGNNEKWCSSWALTLCVIINLLEH